MSYPERIGCRAAALSGSGIVSPEEFRGALANFATSVSVLATDGPAGRVGVTCSAVCSVSDHPATLLACVHAKSSANPIIKANGIFSVNCLDTGQRALSQAFAGVDGLPMPQRFALADWDVLVTGVPCCKDALVTLDCHLAEVREVGTHSIFIANVVATAARSEGEPLVYQQRAYATTRPLA
jgi:flavin reductase (NADH)/flavin reductase/chlorophenol-4-monooxygenase component 1